MAEDPKAKYAIHEACREGQTAKVESLLRTNPKLSTLSDPDSRLPLHWAVSFGHLEIVSLLLQQRSVADDVDCIDSSGWTPLMMACSRRQNDTNSANTDELVKTLLSKGADPNMKTSGGQTALHFAASKTNLDVAKLLLEAKASARVKDKRGQLALHRAAAVGSVPMIKLLLEKGKSPLNATDVDGWTALHHAVSEGHGDAALCLLLAGAEWDKEDREGKRALDWAPDGKTRSFIVRGAEREGLDLE